MRFLLSTVVIFLLAYIALVAYVFFSQNRMVFLSEYAGRELAGTPQDVGLAYHDIDLVTGAGTRIHGWLVPHPRAQTLLIYFHGNAGNIGGRIHSIERWHKLGVSVFIFDYPGYGQSEGTPSEKGTYAGARAAWKFVTQEIGVSANNVILFGRSLGGGVATQLATEVTPKALIVESSFTSVPNLAGEQFWFLPVHLLSRIHFDSINKLKQVNCPVLIVHSPDDEIIPFEHGQSLFEAANPPKQFLETAGGHNDGHIKAEPAYSQGLHDFLTTLK